MSWIADFPHAQGIRRRVYSVEDKLINSYIKLNKRVEKIIKSGSHLEYIWKIIMLTNRQRKSFVPNWKILGPVLNNPDNAQLFKDIINSGADKNYISNQVNYKWRQIKKNPFNNRLEIKKSSKFEHQVWVASADINVEADLSAYLRFFCRVSGKNLSRRQFSISIYKRYFIY